MPQPSGSGPQISGDAPTQLLTPVGHDDTIRYVLRPSPLKGRYIYSPQDQPTAVIPVTPAQPEQPRANDSDPWKEGCPWLIAVGFALAAALLLTGIGLGAWWF